MPSVPELQQLQSLHGALAEALRERRWSAFDDLDAQIREYLQQPRSNTPAADVQQARARLQALHAQALEACRAECQRLRLLLARHLNCAEGLAAYTHIDHMQGEG